MSGWVHYRHPSIYILFDSINICPVWHSNPKYTNDLTVECLYVYYS